MPALTAAAGLSVTYRQQYRRCGSPRCHRCAPGGPGHGPYWYAFWAEGGRTHSRYLGKERPPEAGAPALRPTFTVVPPAAPPELGQQPGGRAQGDKRQMGARGRQGVPAAPAARADQAQGSAAGLLVAAAPAVVASPAAVPPLRVQALGGFAVWRGEEALPDGRWARGKVGALFKLLLSTSRHRLPVDQIIECLWPAAVPRQGAANLRSTVASCARCLMGRRRGRPTCAAAASSSRWTRRRAVGARQWTGWTRTASRAGRGPRWPAAIGQPAGRRWRSMGGSTCPTIPTKTGPMPRGRAWLSCMSTCCYTWRPWRCGLARRRRPSGRCGRCWQPTRARRKRRRR